MSTSGVSTKRTLLHIKITTDLNLQNRQYGKQQVIEFEVGFDTDIKTDP